MFASGIAPVFVAPVFIAPTASGIAPTAINNYIITLPPPLTNIIITQPNILIEPINQTILQL